MPLYPPVTVRNSGTFAYQAGTTTGTKDVPANAIVNNISVTAGAGTATLTIGGGATITVPQATVFATVINNTLHDADIVIGGTVAAWYIDYYVL